MLKRLPLFLLFVATLGCPGAMAKSSVGNSTEQGVALFKQQRFAEAKAMLWQAVGANPRDAEAQAYLGRTLNNFDGDPDQAIQHLEEAVRLDPTRVRFHTWLGAAYGSKAGNVSIFRAMGWASKCRECFEKAVALDPRDVEARSALIQYYLMAPAIAGGSLDKAKEQAKAVAAVDAYLGLLLQGSLAEQEKDLGLAETFYRKALTLAPAKLGAYNSLGYVLLKTKRTQEAVDTFRKAIQVNAADPNAHDSLAEGLLAQGNLDGSLEEYRRALEVDPYFSVSYPSLAQCYLKKNDLQKARQAYEKYLELAPHGAQAKAARKKVEELRK